MTALEVLNQMKADAEGKVQAEANGLLPHLRLIYRRESRGELVALGSAVLIRVGPKCFLVTAAHVLDENKSDAGGWTDLVTYAQTKALALEGPSFRSEADHDQRRERDKTDIGVLELSREMAEQIGIDRFLTPADTDVDDPGLPNALYFALGSLEEEESGTHKAESDGLFG